MARPKRPSLENAPFQGFKYFQLLQPLLPLLRSSTRPRLSSKQRSFHFEHYVALFLFHFFNPVVDSLRALQQASTLDAVQKKLKIPRVSLGSLSEASTLFDPYLLQQAIFELASRVQHSLLPKEASALQALTAVDGSLLPALPRMMWALWQNQSQRAAKLYLHFEVARGIPVQATISPGEESEISHLRSSLQPHRLYVLDRGYVSHSLLLDIINAKSSFILRLKKHSSFQVSGAREVSEKARKAGVKRDLDISRLGNSSQEGKIIIKKPLRVIEVESNKPGSDGWILVTDQLELDAELIALGYKWRWQIELFFRWLKGVIGCRHWLSESENGVKLQVYIALLSCLMISGWTGKKATKRTYEMLQFYLAGLAKKEEVLRHIDSLPQHPLAPQGL